MANNKNANEKQPGENPEGKYHFNPGNMAGKKPGDPEQTDENRSSTSDEHELQAHASYWFLLVSLVITAAVDRK